MNRFELREREGFYEVVDSLWGRHTLVENSPTDVIVDNLTLPEAEHVCDYLNTLNENWKDSEVECVHKQYDIDELTGFDRVDYLVTLIMRYNKESDNPEVNKILNRILNDLDTPLSTIIEYNKRFDDPTDYKYLYGNLKIKYNRLEWLISKQIEACEKGISEVIDGDKDSYIVKHDIAIDLLKQLKMEMDWR